MLYLVFNSEEVDVFSEGFDDAPKEELEGLAWMKFHSSDEFSQAFNEGRFNSDLMHLKIIE